MKIVRGRKRKKSEKESRYLVRAVVSPLPVASKNATCANEKANEEGNKGTEGEPICVTVLRADPVIPDDGPDNSPEDHVDDPGNESAKEGETGDEGHEHGPRTVV